MRSLASLVLSLVSASLVQAVVLPSNVTTRDALLTSREVTALSADALSAITPFAHFAAAAYCPSTTVKKWGCGGACSALPGFEVTLTGGDGAGTQLFYVGYWPSKNAVVVAHQGTDPTEFLADLTDINVFKKDFDESIFPGIDADAEGHGGFLGQHAKTANTILPEVERLISSKGAKTVITVGHSLGGALAELDTLSFTLNLPSDVHVQGVTFGTPRVGNTEYADFFNSHVNDFKRINNKKDPVPIVPGRGLGFSHVNGEIHIAGVGDAVACSGDDDASDDKCTIKTVPNIFKSDILDHLGPYNGVMIGPKWTIVT